MDDALECHVHIPRRTFTLRAFRASPFTTMYTIKGTLSLYIPIDFTSFISIFCPKSVTETIKDNKALTVGFLLGLSLYSIVRYTRSPWRHLPPGPRGTMVFILITRCPES